MYFRLNGAGWPFLARTAPHVLSAGPLAYSMASSASCTNSPILSMRHVLLVRHAAVDHEQRLGPEVLAHLEIFVVARGRGWRDSCQMFHWVRRSDERRRWSASSGRRASSCRLRPSSRPGNRRTPASGRPASPARSGRRPLGRSFQVFFGKERDHVEPERALAGRGDHQPGLGVGGVGRERESVAFPVGGQRWNRLLGIDRAVAAFQRDGQRPVEALAAPGEERQFVRLRPSSRPCPSSRRWRRRLARCRVRRSSP